MPTTACPGPPTCSSSPPQSPYALPPSLTLLARLARPRPRAPAQREGNGMPSRLGLNYHPVLTDAPTGEVSEWPKEQHWKCCMRLKPHRGFESLPLRFPFPDDVSADPAGTPAPAEVRCAPSAPQAV